MNMVEPATKALKLPSGLVWQTGRYAHQGMAVDAFLAGNGRGVLAIATGGGKTKTSLISATLLQERHNGPMLVVILVPSAPLKRQWTEEVADFGVVPTVPSDLSPFSRKARFEEIRTALSVGGRRTEVLVVTNSLFSQDAGLRDLVDTLPKDVCLMLIGDEMHNLGTPTFLKNPPERFDYRLGLSATPIRQYDPDGTDQLFDFFGPQVYEFSLGDAISSGCLTPYEYHLHEVHLTDDEMDRYLELCEKLRRLGFSGGDDGREVIDDDRVKALLRDRRSVLEHAEQKIEILRELLLKIGAKNVRRTLIYASGKKPPTGKTRQIESVNSMLASLGVISHQFTSEETAKADSQTYLKRFGDGDYQVLTAMKVLDEGVDIPQTDTAFLLASSTVRREWVQRRGRILRTSPGKNSAVLHDFFVVPPDASTKEGRAILRGELARAEEFVSLATNEFAPDGPRNTVISKYEDMVWTGG
jgi:superfamily II DNA or RNA helicase